MPDVHSEILINAPAASVYQLARDVERFPDFLPNVQQVTIQSRQGNHTVSEWVGLIPEFKRTIRWVEEDIWDDAALRCEFRSLSGDWDCYQGVWTFEQEDQQCRVRLHINYEYHVPLLGPLIRKLLHKLVARNAEETLQGLRRQAEENP